MLQIGMKLLPKSMSQVHSFHLFSWKSSYFSFSDAVAPIPVGFGVAEAPVEEPQAFREVAEIGCFTIDEEIEGKFV
jgi:hypothetical protein